MITDKTVVINGYKIGEKVLLIDVNPVQVDEIIAFYEESDDKEGYEVWLKEYGEFSFDCIKPIQ